MNLNLISKTISVKDKQLKCSWTKEMSDDLKAYTGFSTYSGYYKYKYENQIEVDLIKKYLSKDIEVDYAYYYMDNKILRKIKLLILKRDEFSEIFEKIIKNSVAENTNTEDRLTRILTKELTDF